MRSKPPCPNARQSAPCRCKADNARRCGGEDATYECAMSVKPPRLHGPSHAMLLSTQSLPRKPEMKSCNTNSDIEARLSAERYRLQCDSPV